MAVPQLAGEIDDRDTIIAGLKAQLAEVREELRLERKKSDGIEPALKEIQRVTLPFFNILRAVHGELDALGISGGSQPSVQTSGSDPRWQSFKTRFPGTGAKIIDALLTHREMTITELSSFVSAHYNTVVTALGQLSKAGAIGKDGGKGGKYHLKD
jgi:hypothetical protein